MPSETVATTHATASTLPETSLGGGWWSFGESTLPSCHFLLLICAQRRIPLIHTDTISHPSFNFHLSLILFFAQYSSINTCSVINDNNSLLPQDSSVNT